MKKLIEPILVLGTRPGQSPHEIRKIRTTNLLNLLIISFLMIGCVNYFVMGNSFSFAPIFVFMGLSVISLLLSKARKTAWAFLLFTFNINLAIFFYCQYHPIQTGTFLFYFPLIVSVVLLNNPNMRDRQSFAHFSLCAVFVAATFLIDIPQIEINLPPHKIAYLWNFNLICSILVTTFLSLLLTRFISKQNREILLQNAGLLNAQESINTSLKEKEILLAELHHRVKNNLAIISGMLNLQEDATTNPDAKRVISDSKNRIMSMALVHRMLYENPELKKINVSKYAHELVTELFRSFNISEGVNLTEEYDNIILPVNKSIPLGLVLNEIITNSIKYVFRQNLNKQTELYIGIKLQPDGMIRLTVRDNGKGFPRDFNVASDSYSLGIYLIRTLAEQIDGKVHFSNDSGARIELNFMPD